MTPIRIFLSSPGDVAQERRIAGRVIDRLDAEFPATKLEPYFWEYEPMVITKDYQEQIPPPSGFDIVICILWSRMGSRMHTKYQRADGTAYRSGTEFEFVDAVEGQKRNDGTPDVLVWINKTQPLIPLEPEEAHLERLQQWRELKAFLEEWTRDEEEQTFKGAVNRYARLDEFEEKLERKLRKLVTVKLAGTAGDDGVPAEITWTEGSPYRGLEAFLFEHAEVFFGRTAPVAAAIDALRRQAAENGSSFLLVAGASGSGKSSLVRAGVLPMLVEPGVIEGIGLWRRATMRPGDGGGNPFAALAQALLAEEALPELAAQGLACDELAKLLRERPGEAIGLGRGALAQAAALVNADEKRELAAKIGSLKSGGRTEDAASAEKRLENLQPPQARLALVIDQFEELFDSAVPEEDRRAFVDLAAELAGGGRVSVLATLRSDFLPRCAELPALLGLMHGDGMLQLGAPTPAELGQMIRQPAQAAGLRFETDPASGETLDETLRDAAVEHPTVLPLLEFCLNELYERRGEGGVLGIETYRELGGVEGALAKRAEEVFADLSEAPQGAFPRLMRSMVTLGGAGDEETATRRRADRDKLAGDPATKHLMDALVDARLFVADADEDGRPTVSVAHEALLRSWPRLRETIDDDRDFLRARARVATTAKRWEAESRDVGFLLPEGRQLSDAEALLAERGDELSAGEIQFIESSSSAVRERRDARIRALRTVAAALCVLAIGAVVGAVFGFVGQGKARRQAELAEAEAERATAAERQTMDTLVGSDITMSSYQHNTAGHAFLARAVRNAPEKALASTFLYTRLLNRPFMLPVGEAMPTDGMCNCSYDRSGTKLLTYPTFVEDGVAQLWDPETGALLAEVEESGVAAAALSPDGSTVVASFKEGGARLFDAATGKARGEAMPDTERAVWLLFNEDGSRLLIGAGKVTAWEISSGERLGEPIDFPFARNRHLAFSPSGEHVLMGSEAEAKVIDARSGEFVFPPLRHEGDGLRHSAFSEDGEEIATGGGDGTARRWNAATGEALGEPMEHESPVIHVRYSPRGSWLTAITQDHRLQVWDTASGQLRGQPMGFNGNLAFFGFLPDGQRAMLSTFNGFAYLIAPATGENLAYELQPFVGISGLAVDPVRERCAMSCNDGVTRLFSTKVSRRASIRLPHRSGLAPEFSDDGTLVAGVDADGAVAVWSTLDGAAARAPIASPSPATALRFSRDNSLLATGDAAGTVKLWPAGDEAGAIFSAKMEGGEVNVIDLSADGTKLIAAGENGNIYGWDTASLKPLWAPVKMIMPTALAFLPGDERFLAAGYSGERNELPVWDTATGERAALKFETTHGNPFSFFFSPSRDTLFGVTSFAVVPWESATGTASNPLPTSANLPQSNGLMLSFNRGNANSVNVSEIASGVGLANLQIGVEVTWTEASPDGSRLLAVTGADGGNMRIWEAFPSGPIARPAWLAELGEVIGGARVPPGENVAKTIPHGERARRLAEMRAEADPATPEGQLAIWLLDDPWTRTISPNSTLKIRDHILRDCAVDDDELGNAMFELFYNYPGHPFIFAGVAERFRELDPEIAAWARKTAAARGETVANFCYELSGLFLEREDYEQATRYLVRAAEEGHDEAEYKARAQAIKDAAGID